MPDGVARAQPNDTLRRSIAEGHLREDERAGPDDPELRRLREAESVLFPKPLVGLTPGWTWNEDGSAGDPQVVANGPPPAARVETRRPVPELSADQKKWLAKLKMPDLPVRLDPRVVKYLEFYRDTRRGRAIARVWAKKSGRFVPALKSECVSRGLPSDLVWLSLIESGHNATIHSPAGAAGLWQFMPAAGRMYGLTVDRWVDERLDPLRATDAALRYLSDLHQRFGNWELAMAAYNMGYGGLSRSIRKYNSNDFWELSRLEAAIPWETALYVPKIMAIAIVMTNKKAFGIDKVAPDEPISFDTIRVKSGTSLADVARAAELPLEKVRELNGHYPKGAVPPANAAKGKTWRVVLPKGRGAAARGKLGGSSGTGSRVYTARFGDRVEDIVEEYGVSEALLRRLNDIDRSDQLRAGEVLVLPPGAREKPAALERDPVVVPQQRVAYADRRRVFYRVRTGDELGEIARAFSVTVPELRAWNALAPAAKLMWGMMLQVWVPENTDLARVRHVRDDDVRVIKVGSDAFFDHFEGLQGRQRLVIRAKKGETLLQIGRRYGLSSGMMERINHRSRHEKLDAGTEVVVYAKRGASGD